MLQHYLKTAFRNLYRYASYSAINIGGLGLCIACCLVILVYLQDERSYDAFHQNARHTYRITTTQRMADNDVETLAPGLLGPALVETLPGVINQVRIRCLRNPVVVEAETRRYRENAPCFADSSLFEVFDFSLRWGDPETALSAPDGIVLSSELADKYFGDRDPLGLAIEIDGGRTYHVTGVLENTKQRSHLLFGLVAPFASLTSTDPLIETWAEGGANPYVVLSPDYSGNALKMYLDDHLDQLMGYFATGMSVHVEPLTDIYFSDSPASSGELRGNIQYLYLFTLVALLLLATASINYVNLATVKALQRAREVGVRKSMGASKRQLIDQFLGESIILCFFAALLAFLIAYLLLPHFEELVDRQLDRSQLFNGSTVLALMALSSFVALVAGGYPAFYLSAFAPVSVFKGMSGSGKSAGRLRKALLVLQFSLSIGLAACTFVLWNQLSYMRDKQLGFDKEHVVLITPTDALKEQYRALKSELLALSDVIEVSTAPLPGHTHVLISSHRAEGYNHETNGSAWLPTFDVDHDFLDLMRIELQAGRNFDPAQIGDLTSSVLINEAAVGYFGWGNAQEAIGKTIQRSQGRGDSFAWNNYTVVGVINNFQSWTMREQLSPVILYLTTDEVKWWSKVLVKIRPNNIATTRSQLERVWNDFEPNRVFEYAFLDEEIDRFYRDDLRQGQLLSVFSVLSVIVACLGLWGIAAYTIGQRRKEIGIRKVLGARVSDLVGMFYKEYLLLVAVAFILAAPATFVIMQTWLNQFADSVGVGWGLLVLVGLGALTLALLTISYQAVHAALADPVDTLKYE